MCDLCKTLTGLERREKKGQNKGTDKELCLVGFSICSEGFLFPFHWGKNENVAMVKIIMAEKS